jgi:glutathione reductase (NADPH)
LAVGREPLTASLDVGKTGLETTRSGHIQVNEWAETAAPNVYAVGDVVGRIDLTPVAIAAGRLLADRLFGGKSRDEARMSFEDIATVTFSHPPLATVGLTETAAADRFGRESLTIYTSRFTNLFYAMSDVEPDDKPKTFMKLICHGPDERVVGLHMIGMGVDEIVQGFAVAIKMGATKADLDRTVAIHPTAAEEVVTLAPWGKVRM